MSKLFKTKVRKGIKLGNLQVWEAQIRYEIGSVHSAQVQCSKLKFGMKADINPNRVKTQMTVQIGSAHSAQV